MEEKQGKKENNELRHRILTVVGIVLCVILIPILIINCTLLIKGWTNQEEVPALGGLTVMIVMTPSMEGEAEDCFNAGDLIFVKLATPDQVSDQQVITFYDPDGSGTSVLTHRVIGRYVDEKDGKTYYITKGDNNLSADPTPAPAENLIGIYTGVRIPFVGRIAWFMQTVPGLIVCLFLPLAAFVAYDIIRRKLYEKKHADDKDELLRELEELRRLKQAAEQETGVKTTADDSEKNPKEFPENNS